MDLDFSKLYKIAEMDNGGANKEAPPPTPPSDLAVEKILGGSTGKTISENKNGSQAKFEGVEGSHYLQREVDARQAEKERNLQIYREYQENKRVSGQLKVEILKGLKAGDDINILFLKACEAIGLMTSEKLFIKNVEADLKAVYGIGLLENRPLCIELDETRGRLTKLKAAQEREREVDSALRIKAAIEAHTKRVEQLEALLMQSNRQ